MNIDEQVNHVMRSHIRGEGYVTLAWPKDLLLRDLEHCREVLNLQLDLFIRSAKRKTAIEEAADAEYGSWFASKAQGAEPSTSTGPEPIQDHPAVPRG